MLASVEQKLTHITNRLPIGSAGGADGSRIVLAIQNGPKNVGQIEINVEEYAIFLVHLKRQAQIVFGEAALREVT